MIGATSLSVNLEASVHLDLEHAVRDNLARVLEENHAPGELDLDLDMAGAYGLTSLNKVLFLMAVCDETGVGLSAFTETDVAAMKTLRDVVSGLARHAGTAV